MTSSAMGVTRKSRKIEASVAAMTLATWWGMGDDFKGSRGRGIEGAAKESGVCWGALPRALDPSTPRPLDPSTQIYFPHAEPRRRDPAHLEALHRARGRSRPLPHRSAGLSVRPPGAQWRRKDDDDSDAPQHHCTR